jgi:hypothetical protein
MLVRHIASAGVVVFFTLFALGSGSSGDKPGTSTTTAAANPKSSGALGACMEADKTKCLEWHSFVLDERAAKGECTEGLLGKGRTWSSGACPTNDTLLGSCELNARDAKQTRFEYKAPGLTSAISKSGCEAGGGTWTDGPGADRAAPKPVVSATAAPKPAAKAKTKK